MPRSFPWLLPLVALGCTPDDGPAHKRADRPDLGPTYDTSVIPGPDDTDTDTDTAPPEPWYDCANVGQPPFDVKEYDIRTEEDFDFDEFGYLIHQDNGDLAGVTGSNEWKLIAPNAGGDPAGLSVLSGTRIALADPSKGTITIYDGLNGGSWLVASGLSRVNSIDVSGNRLYFTETFGEGRVSWVDTETGEQGLVMQAGGFTPAGIAASPDGTTIYLTGSIGGTGYVYAIPQAGNGWGTPRRLFESTGDVLAAIEVDVCGTVWVVSFSQGRVHRIPASTEVAEPLLTLEGAAYSNAHFGNGLGGWRRDTLYITNRNVITAISVGVPGRQHPSNPYDGPDPE